MCHYIYLTVGCLFFALALTFTGCVEMHNVNLPRTWNTKTERPEFRDKWMKYSDDYMLEDAVRNVYFSKGLNYPKFVSVLALGKLVDSFKKTWDKWDLVSEALNGSKCGWIISKHCFMLKDCLKHFFNKGVKEIRVHKPKEMLEDIEFDGIEYWEFKEVKLFMRILYHLALLLYKYGDDKKTLDELVIIYGKRHFTYWLWNCTKVLNNEFLLQYPFVEVNYVWKKSYSNVSNTIGRFSPKYENNNNNIKNNKNVKNEMFLSSNNSNNNSSNINNIRNDIFLSSKNNNNSSNSNISNIKNETFLSSNNNNNNQILNKNEKRLHNRDLKLEEEINNVWKSEVLNGEYVKYLEKESSVPSNTIRGTLGQAKRLCYYLKMVKNMSVEGFMSLDDSDMTRDLYDFLVDYFKGTELLHKNIWPYYMHQQRFIRTYREFMNISCLKSNDMIAAGKWSRIPDIRKGSAFVMCQNYVNKLQQQQKKNGYYSGKFASRPATIDEIRVLNNLLKIEWDQNRKVLALEYLVFLNLGWRIGPRGEDEFAKMEFSMFKHGHSITHGKWIAYDPNGILMKNHNGITLNGNPDKLNCTFIFDEYCPDIGLNIYRRYCEWGNLVCSYYPGYNGRLYLRVNNNKPSAKQPVGKGTLGKYCQRIFEFVGLDIIPGLSNQGLRAGKYTNMLQNGLNASEIVRESNHKSVKSIEAYNKKLTINQAYQYFKANCTNPDIVYVGVSNKRRKKVNGHFEVGGIGGSFCDIVYNNKNCRNK